MNLVIFDIDCTLTDTAFVDLYGATHTHSDLGDHRSLIDSLTAIDGSRVVDGSPQFIEAYVAKELQ